MSGDLIESNGAYRLTPRALTTIAEKEEDDRRHQDQVRQKKVLSALTAALVVVGLLQVLANS